MMVRQLYQEALAAIRAAGDDIGRARLILRKKLEKSQALRAECEEVMVEHALNIALQKERQAAREGRAVEATVTVPAEQKDGGEERHLRCEAQNPTAPSPAVPQSNAEEPGATPRAKPNSPLPPAPPARRSMAEVYRSVARMYTGMLGYRLHTAPSLVIGEATREHLRREIEHAGRKLGTEHAYLGFLGEALKRVAKGGKVGDHLSAEEAQTLYEAQRKAFGERVQKYLAAGAQ